MRGVLQKLKNPFASCSVSLKYYNNCSCLYIACACVASVSVRFRSKERGTRVKLTARKMAQARFISRSVKTENSLPRSFFAPKPNGNACYTGQPLQLCRELTDTFTWFNRVMTSPLLFPSLDSCYDDDYRCVKWAKNGECQKNPGYMLENCRQSCEVCKGMNYDLRCLQLP